MPLFRNTSLVHFATCITLFFGLMACERDSYTTWNCYSAEEAKITMILRKAQMEFKGGKLAYCGSLGNQSYFDQKCPAQTEQSSTILTPSSGALVSNGQAYQCAAL
jgi:hypothetical protein